MPALVGLRRLSAHRAIAILPRSQADVAQLVEHHLAKVRVAGWSPVIRSGARAGGVPLSARQRPPAAPGGRSADWQPVRRWGRVVQASVCKPLYAGSIPGTASI